MLYSQPSLNLLLSVQGLISILPSNRHDLLFQLQRSLQYLHTASLHISTIQTVGSYKAHSSLSPDICRHYLCHPIIVIDTTRSEEQHVSLCLGTRYSCALDMVGLLFNRCASNGVSIFRSGPREMVSLAAIPLACDCHANSIASIYYCSDWSTFRRLCPKWLASPNTSMTPFRVVLLTSTIVNEVL